MLTPTPSDWTRESKPALNRFCWKLYFFNSCIFFVSILKFILTPILTFNMLFLKKFQILILISSSFIDNLSAEVRPTFDMLMPWMKELQQKFLNDIESYGKKVKNQPQIIIIFKF